MGVQSGEVLIARIARRSTWESREKRHLDLTFMACLKEYYKGKMVVSLKEYYKGKMVVSLKEYYKRKVVVSPKSRA
jgi:hypothetical protein